MIVLLLALCACVYSALTLHGRVDAMRREQQARVDAAQGELDAAKAEYAAFDPNTDEGMARQIEAQNQAVAEAQQKTESLQKENETLRSENEALTKEVGELEADEETAYYLKTYESLHKGMEMVEEYINGGE